MSSPPLSAASSVDGRSDADSDANSVGALSDANSVDALSDAMLTASRVLATITMRALSEADVPITLAQFRTLVLVSNRGPVNLATLAHDLGVQPSTTSRMVERLVHTNLLERRISPQSRRELRVELTDLGHDLVERVAVRRHRAIHELVERIPADERRALMRGLTAFAAAGIEMRVSPMVEQIWP